MKTTAYLFFLILLFYQHTLSAQIVNIEERRITGTNDSTYWYGSLRLGANVSKVKDKIFQFNSTGHLQYKRGKTLTLLLLDGKFLQAGNTDFNQSAFAHLRFNYKLTEILVAETYAQLQYNKLLLIELRALTGIGLRFQMLKSKDGQQRIYSGLSYLYEHNQFLEGVPDQSLHRLSSYISFTFRPWEGVKLVNTTYYQPSISRFANYRMATEWRLDTPLGKKLTFFTEFTFSTDQSLPVEAPTSVYAWLNGLAFKF